MNLIQHFESDFFASLHAAKLIQFFFNFSLTIYFFNYICRVVQQALGSRSMKKSFTSKFFLMAK